MQEIKASPEDVVGLVRMVVEAVNERDSLLNRHLEVLTEQSSRELVNLRELISLLQKRSIGLYEATSEMRRATCAIEAFVNVYRASEREKRQTKLRGRLNKLKKTAKKKIARRK